MGSHSWTMTLWHSLARLLDILQLMLNVSAIRSPQDQSRDPPTAPRTPLASSASRFALSYRSQHELHRVEDVGSRYQLRSTPTTASIVPANVRSTIGVFHVAATRAWNSLPQMVTSLSFNNVWKRNSHSFVPDSRWQSRNCWFHVAIQFEN
jgi:hypothetical protein